MTMVATSIACDIRRENFATLADKSGARANVRARLRTSPIRIIRAASFDISEMSLVGSLLRKSLSCSTVGENRVAQIQTLTWKRRNRAETRRLDQHIMMSLVAISTTIGRSLKVARYFFVSVIEMAANTAVPSGSAPKAEKSEMPSSQSGIITTGMSESRKKSKKNCEPKYSLSFVITMPRAIELRGPHGLESIGAADGRLFP